jgi:hypothetical protein
LNAAGNREDIRPRAAATIATTQTAEAKKKKWKRTRSTVSMDMNTISFGVETIQV